MRDDLDFYIEFISEIERHPPLYDQTLPEYVNRHVTDRIWENISAKFDEPVHTCKNKWKIIRSSYVRSIKSIAKNGSKEYYLTKYLQFLNKFVQVKGAQMPKIANESDGEESNESTSQEQIKSLHTSVDCDDEFNDVKPIEEILLNQSSHHQRSSTPSCSRKRTQAYNDFDKEIPVEYLKRTRSNDTETNKEPCEMFMLSLVPYMKTMTQQQQLSFQKGVIELIEIIKYGQPSSTH